MIQYVTPLDWIIWALCIGLKVIIVLRSWHKLPLLSMLMIYQFIETGAAASLIFANIDTYSKAFFIMSVPEYVLIGLAAIEICCKLQPKGARRVIRLGPIIVATPLLLSLIIMIPMAILTMLRMNELAYILSAALLLLCLIFEELSAEIWVARVAWAYIILLGLLIGAIEVLYHVGNHGLWNRSLPLAWLVGLGAVVLSLRTKHGEHSWAH